MIIKWIFDRVVALIGLLVLWPVLLIVAILVKVKMAGGLLPHDYYKNWTLYWSWLAIVSAHAIGYATITWLTKGSQLHHL